MKYENMHYEIWIMKYKIRNMKFEIWNMNHEIWNVIHEVWKMKYEFLFIEINEMNRGKDMNRVIKPNEKRNIIKWQMKSNEKWYQMRNR